MPMPASFRVSGVEGVDCRVQGVGVQPVGVKGSIGTESRVEGMQSAE